MKIKSAEFISSYTTYKDCPETVIPEYAFVGRSNVGKSSLINMLMDRKKLAKTSQSPGKTQLINHFLSDFLQHYLFNLALIHYKFLILAYLIFSISYSTE